MFYSILLREAPVVAGSAGTERNSQIDKYCSGLEGFMAPFGVSIRPGGGIIITDFSAGRLTLFNDDCTLERILSPGLAALKHPHSVDHGDDGSLFVTDSNLARVQRFSNQGEFIGTFIDSDLLDIPATSYFDAEGSLLVADYGSNAVLKFSRSGAFLGWIGARTDGSITDGWEISRDYGSSSVLPGGFDRPHMAITDAGGNIYVADTWNHRIQKFDYQGRLIGWLGVREVEGGGGWMLDGRASASRLPGGFVSPISLQVTDAERLVVLDYEGGRLQQFSLDGDFLGAQVFPVRRAYDFKVDGSLVYITDTDQRKVVVYAFKQTF